MDQIRGLDLLPADAPGSTVGLFCFVGRVIAVLPAYDQLVRSQPGAVLDAGSSWPGPVPSTHHASVTCQAGVGALGADWWLIGGVRTDGC